MTNAAGQHPQPSLGAAEYLEKTLDWSEQVRQRTRTELDVPYGTADRQKLDLYLPDQIGPGLVPVFLFLHGGYWVVGHKDILGFMAPPIIGAPAIFVAAGYRMAPAAKYPAQVDDCRSALAWVYRNIGGYGGDPDRIFVGGHSAGGHLAALITLQTDRLESFQLPQDVVKGCFPVSGVFDLANVPPDRREAFLESPRYVEEASPLNNASGNTAPFLLEIGENDFPNLRVDHLAMLEALRAQGGPVAELERLGHNHFEISLDHGDPNSPWVAEVLEWVTNGPPPRPQS